ncbi:hypothetical protein HYS48_01525, partial [Candidatus Woesearchaeota archaeon]|nr:hypothetical protein [Candidatus Woesearchaeota archaeon]
VKSELKELTYPTYYFELDEGAYNAVLAGANVVLYLDFVDDVSFKKAQIFVNGHVLNVNTKDKQWFAILTLFVDKGSNAVEIVPRSTLDILNLEVVME